MVMYMNIDVSFFIPIYRTRHQWLLEAVDSIVRLCRKSTVKCEILLGDDGSPEPIDLESCRALAPDLIKTWRFPVNRGIGVTSTDLAMNATGRYIVSFDSDDIMLPFDLDAEVAFLDEHPDFHASYAQKFLFNENGLTGEVHGDILSQFQAFFSPKLNINAMLIRREVLASHEYFKPLPYSKINQDVWFMIRLAEDGCYHYSRKPRALYRVHETQNSRDNPQEDWRFIGQDLICRHPEQYRDLLLSETPGTGTSPAESKLYLQLSGLVMFLNQQNIPLRNKMLKYAIRKFPDDYGAWDCLLHIESFNEDVNQFFHFYRQAEERFRQNPDAMLYLLYNAMNCLRRHHLENTEIQTLYPRLSQRRNNPPPIVQEEMKRIMANNHTPKHPTYSFL